MTEAGNNYSEKKTQLHISVRNLVEFIFREGDIDNRSSRAMSADAFTGKSRAAWGRSIRQRCRFHLLLKVICMS